MIEGYQQERARELGYRERGIGKRYSRRDLQRIIKSGEASRVAAFADFIREHHTNPLDNDGRQIFYRGEVDKEALSSFWTEAVQRGEVNTPERLFYMGMDIVRIREGKGVHSVYFDSNGRAKITLQGPKPSDIAYTLEPEFPIFVSFVDYLNITMRDGDMVRDTEYVVTRAMHTLRGPDADFDITVPAILPISVKEAEAMSKVKQGYGDDKRSLSRRVGIHYPIATSDEYGMQSYIHARFTPDQINQFGARLWQAHQVTPVHTNGRS